LFDCPFFLDHYTEHSLGRKGAVDLFITLGKYVIAIEVKIWDKSAKNVSKNNEHQVERYCDYLSMEFKDNDWKFIFLIPTTASPICIDEFKRVCDGKYDKNMKLMTWVSGNPFDDAQGLQEYQIIENSIYALIEDLLKEKERRVKLPLNTLWLLDSLVEIIPDLEKSVPELGRFPNRELLSRLPTWPIFEAFFNVSNRWPSSLTTTVGFPYGRGSDRAELHKNSLYRVRTVTDYYTNVDQQESHLPNKKVELELWPDVYEASVEGVNDWLKGVGLDEDVIQNGYHLDGGTNETVVLSISRIILIDEENVSRLNHILKEGFRKLMQGGNK